MSKISLSPPFYSTGKILLFFPFIYFKLCKPVSPIKPEILKKRIKIIDFAKAEQCVIKTRYILGMMEFSLSWVCFIKGVAVVVLT